MKRQINKVFIFGDSILKGVTYSAERARYVTCKEERFEQVRNTGIEIFNFSHMGNRVTEGLERMQANLNKSNCDVNTLVIIEFGGNDSNHKWQEISENPDGEHFARTARKDFIDTYCKMIDYAESFGANVACCNLVPLCSEKYMNWISDKLSYENILKWLGDIDILYRWQESYDRLVEQCAAKKGVDIIDIRTPFLIDHDYKNTICTDGIHPSVKGHRLIGKIICEFIRENYECCSDDSLLLTGT